VFNLFGQRSRGFIAGPLTVIVALLVGIFLSFNPLQRYVRRFKFVGHIGGGASSCMELACKAGTPETKANPMAVLKHVPIYNNAVDHHPRLTSIEGVFLCLSQRIATHWKRNGLIVGSHLTKVEVSRRFGEPQGGIVERKRWELGFFALLKNIYDSVTTQKKCGRFSGIDDGLFRNQRFSNRSILFSIWYLDRRDGQPSSLVLAHHFQLTTQQNELINRGAMS